MTERACCDDIVGAKNRIHALEEGFDAYKEDAQRWRDQHEARNNEAIERVFKKLDSIESRMTTWVNPIIAITISVLTAIMGILAGALWVIAK